MSTVDQLLAEIERLNNKNDEYRAKLTILEARRNPRKSNKVLEGDIKKYKIWIEKNLSVIIENKKQLTAIQEKDAAKEKYRAERGKTTNSFATTVFLFYFINLFTVPCLISL